MQSSPDNDVYYVDKNARSVVTQPVSFPPHTLPGPIQQLLPLQLRTTTKLPLPTHGLTTKGLRNTTASLPKTPTFIPATEKRSRISPLLLQPRRHRPIMLLATLTSCILMLTLVGLFVAPLDNGQHQRNIIQTLHDAIAGSSLNSFNPLQQSAESNVELFKNLGNCAGTDIWRTCAATDSGMLGTGQMQSPLPGAVITQPFANPEYQQWCGCWKPHTGIDLAMPYGTPVLAADSGQVIWTGWDWSGLGWAVKIYHGHSIATIYGHLARFIVNVGQDVTKGQVIAYEGSTGASTGPHLHFMVLVDNTWVDPTLYVRLP
ncbi:MAG: M23 family metallopeptidase [Ktedonobacteraceae bacterium]|nr:M23 family metallopeptidase [Ktedonobacteraceae bacterium]